MNTQSNASSGDSSDSIKCWSSQRNASLPCDDNLSMYRIGSRCMLKGPTAQRAIPKVYHGRMKNPPVGRGAEPFGGRKHFVVQPFPCRQLPNAACLHCQNRL